MLLKDERIVELIYNNDEKGLHEAEAKYRGLCRSVADSILDSDEDREECVNDAFLAVWRNIPPEKPKNFRAYIARLVKNIALKRSRDNMAWKRRANYNAAGDELLEIIEDGRTIAEEYESKRIGEIINAFLAGLPKRDRDIFVLRFWYGDTVPAISKSIGVSESLIRSLIPRLKKKLAEELAKEGIMV